jgi:hypothetical protein
MTSPHMLLTIRARGSKQDLSRRIATLDPVHHNACCSASNYQPVKGALVEAQTVIVIEIGNMYVPTARTGGSFSG